jgi:dTDP-glucose 4,6-dehydratase
MSFSEKSILLTGASGFAGVHMLKQLLENTEAFIYCPFTFRHGGRKERIDSIIGQSYSDRVRFFECDLSSQKLEDFNFLSNISVIINFASESHVDRSIINPQKFILNNMNLMVNLLEFTRIRNLDLEFIHISTDEVFGPLDKSIDNFEWKLPHLPSNPYSASKSAQESLLISYHKTYSLKSTIVNVTNMIGEAQNQEKFIPMVIRRILENEIINIDTNLEGEIGSRKYIYVGDVAKVILSILNSANRDKKNSSLPRKFHIAGSTSISNLEIVKSISKILKKDFKYTISPSPRCGYDLNYQLSSNQIGGINRNEKQTVIDKLTHIVEWTIKNPEWLKIDHVS